MVILKKFGIGVFQHTLSGTDHTGQLSDNQIPDYVARDSELDTVSGTLYDQIVDFYDMDIDGGKFL